MKKIVYFLSDAHLGSESFEKEKNKKMMLFSFFEKIKRDAEALYILGDLFEFWFEYKNTIPKEHFDVLTKLKEITDLKVKVCYITGNHDFWLGDFLKEKIKIEIFLEPTTVFHQEKKIFLIHGDGLAKKDAGYRFLKKILRNKVSISLYRLIPPDLGIPLAKKVASLSRSHASKKEKALDDYMDFAKNKLEQGYDAVVMGHTHYPMIKNLGEDLPGQGIYLNTGDFFERFSYGRLEQGKFFLEEYKG